MSAGAFPDKEGVFRKLCRLHLRLSVWVRQVLGFRFARRGKSGGENRVFNTMAEYREWCHKNLPPHLGYRIPGRND